MGEGADSGVVTRPLRILVLNLRDPSSPTAGGAEEHLRQLFGRIAARGHRVVVHSGAYAGGAAEETIEGMSIVRRGNRLTTAAWSVLYYLRRRNDFDVIVDYTCQLHFLTPLYVRQPRVAMALHIVGDVYRHDLPWGTGALLAAWEALSLRFFYDKEYFCAICPSTATELQRYGVAAERIKVVRGGRKEPAPIVNVAKTAYPSLVYHGRLKRYKRVDWLIRALPAIREQVPGTRLHIVGVGDQLVALQQLVARLGLEQAVTFHGWLPDPRHWEVVASAWLNVQPSMKEGWNLSVMEAAQLGVPTVASHAPGLRDVVVPGRTGELFEADDPQDLVRQVVRLLGDARARDRFGEEARRWADGFTWEQSSRELEDLLRGRALWDRDRGRRRRRHRACGAGG